MFEDILFPVMIVGIIGLLAGVGLAVAAIVMAVPVDRKAQAIKEAASWANCAPAAIPAAKGTLRPCRKARPRRDCVPRAARRCRRDRFHSGDRSGPGGV